jgi:hypothetical protein
MNASEAVFRDFLNECNTIDFVAGDISVNQKLFDNGVSYHLYITMMLESRVINLIFIVVYDKTMMSFRNDPDVSIIKLNHTRSDFYSLYRFSNTDLMDEVIAMIETHVKRPLMSYF